jgi:hypothetical protein
MPSYKLTFEDNEAGQIVFSGDDPRGAFALLESAGIREQATLWEDDRRLGSLSLCEQGFWRLSA